MLLDEDALDAAVGVRVERLVKQHLDKLSMSMFTQSNCCARVCVCVCVCVYAPCTVVFLT